MKDIYDKQLVGDLSISKIERVAYFYGIPATITFSVYNIEDYVAIRMSYAPTYKKGITVRIPDATTSYRRQVDQEIGLKALEVEIVSFGEFADCQSNGVDLGRKIFTSLSNEFDSLLEYIRLYIRGSFSKDFTDKGCAWLDRTHGKQSLEDAQLVLKDLHWRFLLDGTNANEESINALEYELNNSDPYYTEVSYYGDVDVEPLDFDLPSKDVIRDLSTRKERAEAEAKRQERARKAKEKYEKAAKRAKELLRSVAGDKMLDIFNKHGYLPIQKNGYSFEIPERGFLKCTDPDGNEASLCIHTYRLECHPIDEIVIAYLHIMNMFEFYMNTAIVHDGRGKFQKPAFNKTALSDQVQKVGRHRNLAQVIQ